MSKKQSLKHKEEKKNEKESAPTMSNPGGYPQQQYGSYGGLQQGQQPAMGGYAPQQAQPLQQQQQPMAYGAPGGYPQQHAYGGYPATGVPQQAPQQPGAAMYGGGAYDQQALYAQQQQQQQQQYAAAMRGRGRGNDYSQAMASNYQGGSYQQRYEPRAAYGAAPPAQQMMMMGGGGGAPGGYGAGADMGAMYAMQAMGRGGGGYGMMPMINVDAGGGGYGMSGGMGYGMGGRGGGMRGADRDAPRDPYAFVVKVKDANDAVVMRDTGFLYCVAETEMIHKLGELFTFAQQFRKEQPLVICGEDGTLYGTAVLRSLVRSRAVVPPGMQELVNKLPEHWKELFKVDLQVAVDEADAHGLLVPVINPDGKPAKDCKWGDYFSRDRDFIVALSRALASVSDARRAGPGVPLTADDIATSEALTKRLLESRSSVFDFVRSLCAGEDVGFSPAAFFAALVGVDPSALNTTSAATGTSAFNVITGKLLACDATRLETLQAAAAAFDAEDKTTARRFAKILFSNPLALQGFFRVFSAEAEAEPTAIAARAAIVKMLEVAAMQILPESVGSTVLGAIFVAAGGESVKLETEIRTEERKRKRQEVGASTVVTTPEQQRMLVQLSTAIAVGLLADHENFDKGLKTSFKVSRRAQDIIAVLLKHVLCNPNADSVRPGATDVAVNFLMTVASNASAAAATMTANYVLQSFTLSLAEARDEVKDSPAALEAVLSIERAMVTSYIPDLLGLCTSKTSSNCIEKVFAVGAPELAKQLAQALIATEGLLLTLSTNPFGNYVVRTMLERVAASDAEITQQATSLLRPHLQSMLQTARQYSNRVVEWVNTH